MNTRFRDVYANGLTSQTTLKENSLYQSDDGV